MLGGFGRGKAAPRGVKKHAASTEGSAGGSLLDQVSSEHVATSLYVPQHCVQNWPGEGGYLQSLEDAGDPCSRASFALTC